MLQFPVELHGHRARNWSRGWTSISDAMPPDRKFVLVACRWGEDWTYLTARTDHVYRPPVDGRVRWLDAQNDDLSDGGLKPLYWTEQPLPPEEK